MVDTISPEHDDNQLKKKKAKKKIINKVMEVFIKFIENKYETN